MENTKTQPLKSRQDEISEHDVSCIVAQEEEEEKTICTSSTMTNKTLAQEDAIPKQLNQNDNIFDGPQNIQGNYSSSSSSLPAPSTPERQHIPSHGMLNQQNQETESFLDPAFHHSSYPITSPIAGPTYLHEDNMHNTNTNEYIQTSYPPFIGPYPGPIAPYPAPPYGSVPYTQPCIIHQYIPVAVPVSIVHHYVRDSPSAKAGRFPNRSPTRIVSNQSKIIMANNGSPQRSSKSISVPKEPLEFENSSGVHSSLSSISRPMEQTNAIESGITPEECPSRIVSPCRSPKRRRKRGRRKKISLDFTISEQGSVDGSYHEDDLPHGLIRHVDKLDIYDSENEETQTSTPAASTNDDKEQSTS